jgi:hypothetical protein
MEDDARDDSHDVILIEGPYWLDCGYYSRWLSAVAQLATAFRQLRASDPQLDEEVRSNMEFMGILTPEILAMTCRGYLHCRG